MLKQIIFFSCLGITTEVVFTSLWTILTNYKKKQRLNLALKGHSYLWMLPIYGMIPVIFPAVYSLIEHMPLIGRAFVYGVCTLALEFFFGWLIDRMTGKCPWEYSGPLAVKGYIRLDFLPFWMGFGVMVELLIL